MTSLLVRGYDGAARELLGLVRFADEAIAVSGHRETDHCENGESGEGDEDCHQWRFGQPS